MGYGYVYIGIGVSIVIMGIFLIFQFESTTVSELHTLPKSNATILKENNGILSGTVSFKDDRPCSKWDTCHTDPYWNYAVDIYSNNGTTIMAKANVDSEHHYSVQLSAGRYIIFNDCADNGLTTNRVKIITGETTIFNISCHLTK